MVKEIRLVEEAEGSGIVGLFLKIFFLIQKKCLINI